MMSVTGKEWSVVTVRHLLENLNHEIDLKSFYLPIVIIKYIICGNNQNNI